MRQTIFTTKTKFTVAATTMSAAIVGLCLAACNEAPNLPAVPTAGQAPAQAAPAPGAPDLSGVGPGRAQPGRALHPVRLELPALGIGHRDDRRQLGGQRRSEALESECEAENHRDCVHASKAASREAKCRL